MPEPDRTVDNTTIWVPDFSRDYYMDMLFAEGPGVNSMRNYYIEQSSNRYTVHGDVTDWIPVPGAAATYDDDFRQPVGRQSGLVFPGSIRSTAGTMPRSRPARPRPRSTPT